MFRIKICGVRLKKDIDAVARAGADAIGLNFVPSSIRYVDPSTARQLSAQAAAAGIQRIGVFVNATACEIASISDKVGLDAIQLHGDETTELAGELIDDGRTIIRAINLPPDLTPDVIDDRCRPWIELGCHLLLDAESGGSGKCLDWQVVGQWAHSHRAIPWTLAGGLDGSNVGQAIQQSAALSVDTASGAEEPRGTKSAEKIESFVKASQRAFGG